MPNLIVPKMVNGRGQEVRGKLTITLVDESYVERIGWNVNTNEAIRERTVHVPYYDGTLELVAQADISLGAGGEVTYYCMRLESEDTVETYYVQMQAIAGDYELTELIGLAQIPPGSLLEGRLLPDPTALADGKQLAVASGQWDVIDPPAGSGDVVGPVSAIDERIAVFNSTTGKLLKDGGQTIAEVVASVISQLNSAGRLLPESPTDGEVLIASGGSWVPTDTLTASE